MKHLRTWIARFQGFIGKRELDRDFSAELESHVQMHVEENVRAGMTPEEARRQALVKLGGLDQTKEACREQRSARWLETLLQDVRFGLRMLGKNPGFTAVALLTLALGIGANTAIYSVIDGVLLNPLPFPQPGRLFSVHSRLSVFPRAGVSYPNYLDWQRESKSFQDLAVWRSDDFTISGERGSELLGGEMVSSNFFATLRVVPIRGRLFQPEEDQLGAARVAVISAGLWKRRFGSDPDICGKSLTLNGKAFTIVGVVPSRFPLIRYTPNPDRKFDDVFVPIGQWDFPLLRNRLVYYGTEAIGRLKDGVTAEQARVEMNDIARALEAAYPKEDSNVRVNLMPLAQDIAGDLHPALLMLWGAVGLVLFIACANVANLLLARTVGRRQEFGVRMALGASRGRMARQLLVENVLLACAGGALGVGAAGYGVRIFSRLFPSVLPSFTSVTLDGRVLLFALAVSFCTGILCGLAATLSLGKNAPQQELQEAGRGVLAGRRAVQRTFVAAEVGLALALLIGAGLLIRSLAHVWAVDPGFDPHNVLVFGVEMSPDVTSNPGRIRRELHQLNERLTAIAGVESTGFVMGALPMSGDSTINFWPNGTRAPEKADDWYRAQFYPVGGEYFQAMRIPLIRGRRFTEQDDLSHPDVVIIDEDLANRVFPGSDPVGQRLWIPAMGPRPIEIIGVVGHVKHWGLDGESKTAYPYEMYLSSGQIPDAGLPQAVHSTWLAVRTTLDPRSLASAIRHETAALNRGDAIYGMETMDAVVSNSLAQRRFSTVLLAFFAAIALLLATIGVYGVVSYLVGMRTREIGIRMAMGAQRQNILKLVLHQNGMTVLAGIGLGLIASLGLMRLIAPMLFGISATDPLTFVLVAAILLCVGLAACWIPARRAMRVDPMIALRYE